MRAPTTSWWWKLTPPPANDRVLGLPDVVEQRGQAHDAARGRVLRTTAIVCASTSLCVWIGSCSSRIWLSSGRNSSDEAGLGEEPQPGARVVDQEQLRQLVADALRAHDLEPVPQLDHRAGRAPGRARARTARRSAPRAACAAGRRGTTPRARAACAADGRRGRPRRRTGRRAPGSGSRSAIAFTVKSRRERSVSMSSENATSGLRLSGRYTSARNVVISSARAVLATARRCRTADPAARPRRPTVARAARRPRGGRRS